MIPPRRPSVIRLAPGLCLATLLSAATAIAAAPYPTNRCVSGKQKAAGRYCKAALKAWSGWETTQDDAARDTALAAAGASLGTAWMQAEAASAAEGADCADTTLSSADAQAHVDAAIDGIVSAVNTGLDLGNPGDAKCGSKLVKAAGGECGALLKAEAKYIKALEKDRHGTERNATIAKAAHKFSGTWRKLSRGCPTGATDTDVAARVDAIRTDIALNTTVSPNVDATQFTTYAPTTTHYVGRDFTPVCMNGSPYYYFAKRGSVNKLLVYYQGGGACWEQLTCSFPSCDTSVDPTGSDNPNGASTGFADLTNPDNPFRDWNVVFVPYCTCDVHFGDAARDYPLHVEHRGYQNSRVVEKWAREHFVNPEVVFVTGSSAGAYGAWFNAPLLHFVWPASKFDVLADAGNGVITQDFLDTYFPNWNFAGNLPPEIPELADVLANGSGIPGYTEVIANHFPETRWAHYASAFDGGFGGQTSFYNIMLNGNNPVFAFTWWQGSCAFNSVMRSQAIATAAAVPDNYRYYIGTGSRHTMWGSPKVYTDTTGGVPTLVSWLDAMLDGSPAWTDVECTNCGLLLPGDPQPTPTLQPPFQMVGSDVVVDCSPGGAFLD
jgi:hypothetical protein